MSFVFFHVISYTADTPVFTLAVRTCDTWPSAKKGPPRVFNGGPCRRWSRGWWD